MAIQNKKTVQNTNIALKKWIIVAGIVIGLLAVSAGAYYYFKPGEPDPAKMSGDQIQTYMQSKDFNSLPGEQKRAFFEKVMDSRVDGYFKTPPAQRDAFLDKVIDDMQKARANFERGPRDPNRMRQMGQNFRNATPEQRRLRNETRDPIKSAMRREFFMALMGRAQQRGIQMGGFGGGRGGRGG